MKEFWIWLNTAEVCKSLVSDKKINFSEAHKAGYGAVQIHVRTVDPSFDAMVLELVEALEYYKINLKGLTVDGDIPAIQALAKYEAWKKK